ncbi:MAG: nucleotidyltransferase family protein [Muribaculum sp.]|nr:nucleotidyltransferase family protein [Muribaculum sp.]
MKAMIFAAGLGTRLRPLTENMPKALVPVNGIRMIDRAIKLVKAAGADTIVVNVHHFADMLTEYICSRYDNIIISDERECLLDTGGGVLAARCWLDGEEPVVLFNADILTDVDVAAMVDRHMRDRSKATLLVDGLRESSRKLLFTPDGYMRGWINEKDGMVKPSDLDVSGLDKLAFGGVHVISPSLFIELERYAQIYGNKFSITSFYIDACQRMRISAYVSPTPYQWYDIGSVEKLAVAERNFAG